ncbi:MAG: CDP-diacylglycerol--serine O-phosphatidyltransferase [Dysgonamonadaceae bacterium]|jgi:CDP-diacylglycerol--serine O-phosphatidyltransferase|nr:CDP-diacylglycerol--serine O-phosphatidyltransferase [Dysgonamonadaceae bacterium]
MIKLIPNTITCLNLFSGCLACVMALRFDNFTAAFWLIVAAAVFDFCDGFAARGLKAFSPIGADLDSLADVIGFGLAPGAMIYSYLNAILNGNPLAFAGFILPVFAALRLAKFNVDTRQTTSFLGLPVPASALFWASLIPVIRPYSEAFPVLCSVVILVLMLAFCGLMVSEIPMFSLKFKNFRWKDNQKPFLLITISAAYILIFAGIGKILLSLSFIILTYILMSVIVKPEAEK